MLHQSTCNDGLEMQIAAANQVISLGSQ